MLPTISNGWKLNDLRSAVVSGKRYRVLVIRQKNLKQFLGWIGTCRVLICSVKKTKITDENRVIVRTSSGGPPDESMPPYDEYANFPEHHICESWLLAITPLIQALLNTNDLVTLIGKCAKVIVAPEAEGTPWRERRVK